MSKGTLAKLLVGARIGFGIGVLVATKSGKETRKDIKEKFNELESKLKDMNYADLKEGAVEKLEELKVKISELDEDKTKEVIKEKMLDIKDRFEEFTKFVKKKSSPVIKKIVSDINEKLESVE